MLFTQNIDCLERQAGVPGDCIVEAHGSFATQRCIDCKKEFPDDLMKEHVFKSVVPRCADKKCNGLVKPDIVFFGEQLPPAFFNNRHVPAQADLILIVGTSLTVQPFASLPDLAKDDTPRVLFNMERVGTLGSRPDDVLALGDCDTNIRALADELGWRDELEAMWRRVVGEKEAEKQLRSVQERQASMQDELEDLADRVGAGLHINDDDGAGDGPSRAEDGAADSAEEQVAPWSAESQEDLSSGSVSDSPDDTTPPSSESRELTQVTEPDVEIEQQSSTGDKGSTPKVELPTDESATSTPGAAVEAKEDPVTEEKDRPDDVSKSAHEPTKKSAL